MQFKAGYFLFFFSLIFFSCVEEKKGERLDLTHLKEDTTIRYAKRFSVLRGPGIALVYLFGKKDITDTSAIFLICKDPTLLKKIPSNITAIKSPCNRIAALSSIYATMFAELGCINNLVAIDNIDYVNNEAVIDKYNKKELRELAKNPDIDLEQSIALHPDIIFTFGMGETEVAGAKKLAQAGIPLAVTVDHLEETPLARAEWVKFFAVFVDKSQKADSIFNSVEKKYLTLKQLASASTSEKPSVFSEVKFGDTWYMPGGKSYMATLINDAGGKYLWSDDSSRGSLPLSFEQVYAKAAQGEFWINLPLIQSKEHLLAGDKRYAEFNAFKKRNLFNNTKHKNKLGYSTYWETGMLHPERILSDLVQIFHQAKPGKSDPDLFYYEQIR